MGRKQNRCSKQQREIRRAANADIFNNGFVMGYEMGYSQGCKDTAEKANKEIRKIWHKGK
jgi:flagellar biosynthesis/type III secretory pathway protein FliH